MSSHLDWASGVAVAASVSSGFPVVIDALAGVNPAFHMSGHPIEQIRYVEQLKPDIC
jgi:hypothetical protein